MNKLGCWLTRKRLVEYLYGELSGEKKNRITSHLETCSRCRKIWDGIKTATDAADRLIQPEPPGAFWDYYSKRVTARISENRRRRPVESLYGFKKFLVPSLSFLLLFSILLGGARYYRIDQEITRNRELYQNVEEIWNLDLIDQLIQDEVVFSEPANQPNPTELRVRSKKEVRQQFHKFRNLPVSEQNLILANYQKWTGYPESKQIATKRIYRILNTADHPALKKLK